MGISFDDLRIDYTRHGLTETEAGADPFKLFGIWLADAVAARLHEPNAMTLATVTPAGRPAARVVLLKDFDTQGFVFYTNYESRKGVELAQTPFASLVFWWGPLERQVRIDGAVTRVEPAESDAYFASRPLGSRIGAWASQQSRVINGRAELEQRLAALTEQYRDGNVARPPAWGGYRVTPDIFEFWQGRPSRLHDRLQYSRSDSGWSVIRLSP